MDVTVSEAVSAFFLDQCIGTTPGHMANIPNNTTLYSLMQAHCVHEKDAFVRFLRQVADNLDKEPPF